MTQGLLNDNDLARLHAKFVVPLAVSRILRGLEKLDDVAEYTINDIIGELQPDTALLCIALCTQHVATHTKHLPIGRVAGIESNRIVDEYGPLWLAHEAGQAIDERYLVDALTATPDHLEELGDLLLALCGAINDERHALPAILADILGQQALMHKELAEEQLRGLAIRDAVKTAFDSGSNVIPFPRVSF